jgi:serine/threonine protein kinase
VPACRHCSAPYQGAGVRFCGSCGGALEADREAEPDAWLGRVVDHRYRVLHRLGSGGMGVVYQVEHVQLGKVAAMKVLHADGAKDREVVRRFRLEAQSVSQLSHPNIVQTFDFGQWDGSLFLIMEYVKGEDLGALLAREGPMPFPRSAKLFIQVCSALTEAHDNGIIHRDLKPENLMCIRRRDGSEHAKVLDFGLAKLREREESAAITAGGQVVGTPYYMAPEQVRAEALDPRADVYSLGATLYRVLTGFPPFQAASPVAVLSKHITDQVIPPRQRAPELNLPPEADAIVLRAMAKSARDRYESAAEVQADFERALSGMSAAAAAASSRIAAAASSADPREVSRTGARTVSIDDSDLGDGGHRLRRRDLDRFEHSLRRRRLLYRLIVPAVLASLAVVGTALYLRSTSPTAVSVEREPNNSPGYANVIASDVAVKGKIGKMLEGGRPDLDYFRVPVGRGKRVLSARLEGIPDIDLVLELFDSQGRRLAKADSHGRGWGERLQPLSIGPAEAYLLVREVWVDGTTPSENLGDRYVLTARWGAPEAGWELEPNDWEQAATPMAAGHSIRGYFGSDDDLDWFVIVPTASGTLSARVSSPAGVDVVLIRDSATKSPCSGGVATKKRAASKEPDAEKEDQCLLPAVAGQPISIGVMRKPASDRTGSAGPLPGLDEPYELRTELIPAK